MFKFMIDNDVELRLLELLHSERLFKLINSCRPFLKQWLPWVDETKEVADTKQFIEMTRQQLASNNGIQAGIWYKGTIAGVIGFHSINWHNKSTSIGYWLGETFQGKGIMTKACRAFINYAFNELNLNRVEIRCAEQNYRSRAIPERLKFINEGRIRQPEWLYDHYVDHVVYGILAREWI